MKIIRLTLIACLLALSGAFQASAADLFEDFNDWPLQTAVGDLIQEGWFLNDGYVRSSAFGLSPAETPWIVNTTAQGYPDSGLRTPLLQHGAGILTFDTANKHTTGEIIVYVHSATNEAGPWTLEATVTNTAEQYVYQTWSNAVNFYGAGYLRFTKNATGSAVFLGIDNVHITDPPARVTFDTPYTDPATPGVDQAAHVYCTVTTSSLATITSTKLIYSTERMVGTNTMSLTATPDLFKTDTPIPAQDLMGMRVNYELLVTFVGTNTLSPMSITSSYWVAETPFDSDYNLMQITGSASTNMTAVSNRLWRGIATVASPLTDASFQFRGSHTNGVTTNLWGDTVPVSTSLVARGTAGIGEAAFSIDSMPVDDYVFMFNEASSNYTVNSADVNNFDGWIGAEALGAHTNGGWIINDGWVTSDAERRRGTQSCYLTNSGNASVRSPEQTNGVGQISFWVRHWQTNATPATELDVQVSETGGGDANEWVTIRTIAVDYRSFNRFVIPYNNRYDSYVRLRSGDNTDGAMLAIDEFTVAGAGAGVVFSNLIHSPASPFFTNTVSVSVELDPLRGASPSAVTAYWRTGTSGGFTPHSMSPAGAQTWTTDTPFPAAIGDGEDGQGAGTVQYYVDASFTGFESALGSPTATPRYGREAPTSYQVQPAQMYYTNVFHNPLTPDVNSSFTVETDVLPLGGAVGPSVALYYRTGEEGGFTSVPMVESGGNTHFVTQSSVPTPSHPGTPVQYYIRTTFSGPSAASPVYYPAGGAGEPISVLTRAAPVSDFTNMVVEGTINGSLLLYENHQWVGVVTIIGSTTDPAFHFKATSSTATNTWVDSAPISDTFPLFGTAVPGEGNITLSGTYSNTFVFHFNETSGLYRANGCTLKTFDTFPLVSTPSSTPTVDAAGWSVLAATVFQTNGIFDGRSVGVGGTVTDSWSYARSPAMDGGIGNISFWYRNLDETGLLPGALSVEIRENGGDWVSLESVTDIRSVDYLYHETSYATSISNTEVQVLWSNGSNPEDAPLAIDNICIEHLGPYAVFSNLTHIPLSPSVTNEVTVDVDITPVNHATNLSASLWYRVGASGAFETVSMSDVGDGAYQTDSPIPRGEAGLIEYYVRAAFETPQNSDPLYAYAPEGGANNPASYTNSDDFAAVTYVETYEGWVGGTAPQTNNAGWIVNDTRIANRIFGTSPAETIWLRNSSGAPSTTNSYLRTPYLQYGAGAIRFEARNKDMDSHVFPIQYSTNGVDNWQTIVSITNIGSDVWNWHTSVVDVAHAGYFRIKKTVSTLDHDYLGVDNVFVYYPSARVAISDIARHPHYPADSDTVNITCNIASVEGLFSALGITARVYHKLSSESSYTMPPIEMVRTGGNSFTTVTGIPAYQAGESVDYYVESSFKGYYSAINYSPTVSPAGAPAASLSYPIRTHQSDYNYLTLDADGVDTITMRQSGDAIWFGVLNFETPANDAIIAMQGYDFYDGTNVIEGLAATWGDPDNDRTNLPYAREMQIGETNLLLHGEALGQYILVFDEATRSYTLRRGLYQDFNTWPAVDDVFEYSVDTTEGVEYYEDFSNTNDWPRTSAYVAEHDFEDGWTSVSSYFPPGGSVTPGLTYPVSQEYVIRDSLIVSQLVGQAAMLSSVPGFGLVRSYTDIANDGTGTFEFDIRCVNDELAPTIHDINPDVSIMVEASISASAIPENTTGNSHGYTYVSLLAHYASDTRYYELRLVQVEANKYRLEIWKRDGSSPVFKKASGLFTGTIEASRTIALLYYQDGAVGKLRAYLNGDTSAKASWDDGAPITDGYGIGFSGMDADIDVASVAAYRVASVAYNVANPITLSAFGTGLWDEGGYPWSVNASDHYVRPGYTADPLTFTVDYITYDDWQAVGGGIDDATWTTAGTYSSYTNTRYQHIEQTIERPEDLYVRVKHTGGTGHLIVDNVRADYWRGDTYPQTNGWEATEAWIRTDAADTAGGTNILELRTSRALTNAEQYIRSPLLTNGAAIIEFNYKTATTTSNDLIFRVEHTREGFSSSWEHSTAVVVTNTIGGASNAPDSWTPFSWRLPEGGSSFEMYMRVENISTDWGAGMLIDNIRISEAVPITNTTWRGYNVMVTAVETNKLLTEAGNIKGAYINNHPTNDTDRPYTEFLPFIETPLLSDGIGEVSFWYRAWDTTPSQIDILASPDRYLPEAQWTLLGSVENITNQDFQFFSEDFYSTNTFVRLRVNSGGGFGRACVDNLLVATPFAVDLDISRVDLIPAIPVVGDDVFIEAEVDNLFLSPSDITLRAFFRRGTDHWGDYTKPVIEARTMQRVSPTGYVYRSTIPFVAGGGAIDDVVQYYVEAAFDGLLSELSSPVQSKAFTNPPHYWPIDLNDGQPKQTPYYVNLSCLPGQVWINELNVADDYAYDGTTNPLAISPSQFIELCGVEGVDISNWKITTYAIDINANVTKDTDFTIPESTQIPSDTNNFGFYVLGKAAVTERDQLLTNDLPTPGGIHLVRSMGAVEQSICYDTDDDINLSVTNNQTYRFVYVGLDDYYDDTALRATGTGSNLANFARSFTTTPYGYSPGAINANQTLVPWSTNGLSSYAGALAIDSFWTTTTSIHMVVTAEAEGLTMTPWYSTNLLGGIWAEGDNPGQEGLGTTYTVRCDRVTGVPGAFYKVTTP